jgi:gliding motility-associated lipoprotein GldH
MVPFFSINRRDTYSISVQRFAYPYLFLLVIAVSLTTACGPAYQYEQYYTIDNGQWTYADSLQFNFNVEDSTTIYDVLLEVDHSTAYKNQNLYVRINTVFPNGQRQSEPLSIELSDPSTGFWEGKCSDDQCEAIIPIQQSIYFNQLGDYQIIIEQYMRRDPVDGVLGLGLMLLPVQ